MRRFIECLIPTTLCNLRCNYCYVIQQDRRKNKKAIFKYSPEIIGKGLSKKRLGGTSLISLTASGETFISPELPAITLEILKQGHFINITTNGTLTAKINKFLEITERYHSHIHISFSLHYVELLKHNLLDTFFKNIEIVRKSGCSILVQINLSDEYLPHWEDIKSVCLDKVETYPQVALTRREVHGTYEIMTDLMTNEEYINKGKEMMSPLFDFTCNNFMVKRQEYCYAGYWSAKLNLATGEMTGCYGNGLHQNIFENINKPIIFLPIGNNCCFKYCFNSSHFISQGIIPELLPQPSYGELRNREIANWYTPEMKVFLYKQFTDTNPELSIIKKKYYNIYYIYLKYLKKLKRRFCYYEPYRS